MAGTVKSLLVMVVAFMLLTGLLSAQAAGSDRRIGARYPSSISSDADGPLDLWMEVNYDTGDGQAPIAVVMHGYSPASGNFENVRSNAYRLRDAGFFVISVAMRGRDGSDGERDSGGLEIHDIVDAVEFCKTHFPLNVDPGNVHITGYSGGGGNVMSALTKFPDYFRVGSAFFGMSDYGYEEDLGWYNNGAGSNHQYQLRLDVGNPNLGNPHVEDRYMARASSFAAKNNPYSEIHLFVNANESICPHSHSAAYRDRAVEAASYDGEFDNIHLHTGYQDLYEDFDGDGVYQADERQYWPHQFPTYNQQAAAEQWYLDRLLDGEIPQPVMNDQDELYVAGFVKCKPFELWLGDGQNAAADLAYSLSVERKVFRMELLSNSASVTGRLTVNTSDMTGLAVGTYCEGDPLEKFIAGDQVVFEAVCDDEDIMVKLLLPGDATDDGTVTVDDLGLLAGHYGTNDGSACWEKGDFNLDGKVGISDLGILAHNWGRKASAVPEPATLLFLAMGATGMVLRQRGGTTA